MHMYLKLDIVDENDPIITHVMAKDLNTLLKSELKRYKNDDRLELCEGQRNRQLSVHSNSIKWKPGDGSWPTIAVFGPANEETEALFREIAGIDADTNA